MILSIFTTYACKETSRENRISDEMIDRKDEDRLISGDSTLINKNYKEINESIIGYFRLMGDVAIFNYCSSGKILPISAESSYIEVEKQYLAVIKNDGEPLYVEIIGKVESRENLDGKMTPHLIIDSLIFFDPKKICE